MLKKTLIFTGHNCNGHIYAHLCIHRDPMVYHAYLLATGHLLSCPDEHQRGYVNGTPFEYNNAENCACEEKNKQHAQIFLYLT